MDEDWPILLVSRFEDENWHFVDGWGDTEDPADAMTVHAAHLLDRDPSLAALADIPIGHQAWRRSADDDWVKERIPAG